MTQISRDDVLALARLSSLQLTDDETDALTNDLGSIIKYVQQLDELDTTGVEPTYQVTGLQNIWRQDEVSTGINAETLTDLAPETKDNQIKVPKVL